MLEASILVYGLAKGNTERYMEELLAGNCKTEEHVQKVIAVASAHGFHSFRIAHFNPDIAPNFGRNVLNV